ncbi:hypothetical protein [Allosphingosinicella sp.]|uniref:hypothetical protein n=1 Tax=Allosphingosinicella sp. TaxID=2823234 RepID=UPI002FC25DD1
MTTTDMDRDTETGRSGRVSAARDKVREKTSAARERASDAYNSARERTGAAYGSARENASYARQRTADGIDANPAAALIGGLALGALVAAILPKTRREDEMFGDYGRRLNDRAREAALAARDAGTSKLDEMGFNKDTAKQRLDEFASSAGEAARTSASAAAQTLKRTPAR